MYLEHFGLAVNPFGLSPKLDFLYKSSVFEESMAHLIYGLDNSEAIVLITGAIGTGKTMALQSFLSHLGGQFSFALVTNTRVNSVELLKLILDDLGVKVPIGADKSDLLILFKDHLLEASRQGRRVLVVVDEAQNLSRDVLEEIRLLTNLGQGEGQPVQIILLGQPELEQILAREDLAQLRQRIRVHYRLDTLSRSELAGYLDHRMQVAGGEAGVFSRSAADRIFSASGGVPRVVNTMAGEALLSAFVAGHRQVQVDDVEYEETAPIPKPHAEAIPPLPPAPKASVEGVSTAAEEVTSSPADPVPAVMATRVKREHKRSMGVWWVLAVLVVGLGCAYFLGYLEPLKQQLTRQLHRREASVAVVEPNSPTPAQDLPVHDTSEHGAVGQELEPVGATAVAEKTTATPPAPETAGPARAVASSGQFFLHVSSFRTPDRAENVVAGFAEQGLAALAQTEEVRGTLWHRVYVGPFESHEEARVMANELIDAGQISYYKIVRLDLPAKS